MNTHLILAMGQSADGGGGGGLFSTILMFAFIIGIFYFLILRPQQKRQKERQVMLDHLHKGDKIVTSGGMHGTISGIDEKTILVQVSDTLKLKFERSAVSSVLREGEPSGKGTT